MGGRDHPDVHLAGLRIAYPFQFFLLQHPQQAGLGARREFHHLVEEQGAAVGAFETAHARLLGAGVGAALDTEQLGFDQVRWNGRAVQCDEGPAGAFAAQVKAARHDFLADAGFPQQQDRRLARRGLVDQGAGLAVERRLADAVVLAGVLFQALAHGRDLELQGLEFFDDRVALEVAHELLGVLPFLHRLADDAAARVAAAAAADFLVEHLATEEERRVADGVAKQGPAHRLVGVNTFGAAVLHLVGVLPFEVGVELAVLDVDVHRKRVDLDHALEGMQLRAGEEHLHRIGVGAQLARQLGVLQSGLVTQAQEQTLGAFLAEHFHQLAAERAHGGGLEQQHALLVEPDLALVAEEADPVGQVLQGRAVLRRLVINFHRAAPQIVLVRGGRRTTARAGGCKGSTGRPVDARKGRVLFSKRPESHSNVNRPCAGEGRLAICSRRSGAIEQMVNGRRPGGPVRAVPSAR
ncbi:hypothetical protein FQZ97_394170 [compost metagenome]